MARTILLTRGYEPAGIVSWFKAFCLLYEDKAHLLWEYPDKKLHSVSQEYSWPCIVALKYNLDRKQLRSIVPNKKAILIRDSYICQYCGALLTNSSGTRDHIIPKKLKGQTVWTNLVASCKKCQIKKSHLLPEECNMFPKIKPKVPTIQETFAAYILNASKYEKQHWIIGLENLGLSYIFSHKEELCCSNN
jgi:5-methylcytosine-specific restriction endonuclease McrA